MGTERYSLRQQILDALVVVVRECTSLEGAEYGYPWDYRANAWAFNRRQLPWAWVYDEPEEIDAEQATDHLFVRLGAGIEIGFNFDAEGNDTMLLRRGNSLLAELQEQLLKDESLSGLAFNLSERANDIQEVPDVTHTGRVILLVQVQYYRPRGNPYAQT